MQDLKPGHTVRDEKTQHGHASSNITNMDSGQETSVDKAKYASIVNMYLPCHIKVAYDVVVLVPNIQILATQKSCKPQIHR